jgi:c-di-GMP-binding flagellar brake protein YcgR
VPNQAGENQTDVDREKRKHFRTHTDIPCEIGLHQPGPSSARILNLSAGGLKFGCDRATIHNILPEDQRTPGRVWDVRIEIHFTLQAGDRPAIPVSVNARVIHSERLAQDEFHVGVEFSEIDAATLKALEDYLLEAGSHQPA